MVLQKEGISRLDSRETFPQVAALLWGIAKGHGNLSHAPVCFIEELEGLQF